jgi:hypothetical protein
MNLKLVFFGTSARARRTLNLLSVMILAGGLGWAGSIWLAQDRIDRQTKAAMMAGYTEPLSADDSRRYSHDVEVYYGKSGLLLDKWTRRLEALTHGKGLAEVIAVVSVAVAGGLFFVAARFSYGRR